MQNMISSMSDSAAVSEARISTKFFERTTRSFVFPTSIFLSMALVLLKHTVYARCFTATYSSIKTVFPFLSFLFNSYTCIMGEKN